MSELDRFDFEDREDRDSVCPTDAVEVCYDRILYETPAAFLMEFGKSEVWVPKSQISKHRVSVGMGRLGGSIFVPVWLADAKGLDYEDEV